MAVMSAIHPTTYAPLCVEVGEFLPLYVKIKMKLPQLTYCVKSVGVSDLINIKFV